MKLLLVCVGKAGRPFSAAIAEYERRAARYWKLQVEAVKAGASGRRPAEAVRTAEAERIRAALPETADRWCLTREGSPWASEEWARRLGSRALRGARDLALVVGGADGLHPELLDGASERVSLGPVTLPHELARLVLVEQLYRAGTILRNEPYHKGTR